MYCRCRLPCSYSVFDTVTSMIIVARCMCPTQSLVTKLHPHRGLTHDRCCVTSKPYSWSWNLIHGCYLVMSSQCYTQVTQLASWCGRNHAVTTDCSSLQRILVVFDAATILIRSFLFGSEIVCVLYKGNCGCLGDGR